MTTSIMLKIVLDANILISAFIYHGMSKIILGLILEKKIKLYTSSDLKEEILGKLNEFRTEEEIVAGVKLFLDTKSIFVIPSFEVKACRDPKDNYILELAQTCKANYIITRDKDLLELPDKRWKNTKIIKPEEFLRYLRSKKMLR